MTALVPMRDCSKSQRNYGNSCIELFKTIRNINPMFLQNIFYIKKNMLRTSTS